MSVDFNDMSSETENKPSIGSRAFMYCSGLTEIDISDNIVSVGDYAFYNCTALRHVYNHAIEPQKITMIFNTPQVTVHVPAQSLEAYKKDFNWRKYNIVGDL